MECRPNLIEEIDTGSFCPLQMLAVSNSLVVTSGALVHMFVGYFVAMATSHRLKVWVYHAHFVSPALTTIVTT